MKETTVEDFSERIQKPSTFLEELSKREEEEYLAELNDIESRRKEVDAKRAEISRLSFEVSLYESYIHDHLNQFLERRNIYPMKDFHAAWSASIKKENKEKLEKNDELKLLEILPNFVKSLFFNNECTRKYAIEFTGTIFQYNYGESYSFEFNASNKGKKIILYCTVPVESAYARTGNGELSLSWEDSEISQTVVAHAYLKSDMQQQSEDWLLKFFENSDNTGDRKSDEEH